MFLPPQSSARPPSLTVPMRPPSVPSRSTMADSSPRCFRKNAAARPDAPPPTMIQRSVRDKACTSPSSDRISDDDPGSPADDTALRDDDIELRSALIGKHAAAECRFHPAFRELCELHVIADDRRP